MKKGLLILFGVAVAGGLFFAVRGLRPVAVEEAATGLVESEAKVVSGHLKCTTPGRFKVYHLEA